MSPLPPDPDAVVAPRVGSPAPLWTAGALLGEGLCWSPALQSIYWVDILGRRLMRLHLASGARDQWDFDDTISAVAERSGGEGLIVAMRRGIGFFDAVHGVLSMRHEPEPHLEGNRFNDGKCDPQGRFWAGSMDWDCQAPTGSLYRVTPHDGTTDIARAWDTSFPVFNGPAWSPDGRTMWVNDTARNFIHRGDFDPATGEFTHTSVWLRLPKGDGYPDGMTTDRAGRLWIAHWAGACVTCHASDDGRELARIALPTSNVTNVAFGGPDLRTLFITTAATELNEAQRASEPLAGALFAVDTEAVGVAPHRFAG